METGEDLLNRASAARGANHEPFPWPRRGQGGRCSPHRVAGEDLGGRRPPATDSEIRSAIRLIESGEPATQVAKDRGMSRATLYQRIRELLPSVI